MKILRDQFDLERRFHFEILNESDVGKRLTVYRDAYNAFYAFIRRNDPAKTTFGSSAAQIRLLHSFFDHKTVVDYGCGYGESTVAISETANHVYGVDIAADVIEMAKRCTTPKHVNFLTVEEMDEIIPNGSVDVFYSSNVFEHMHPTDLLVHLEIAWRKLRSGGHYMTFTPHAFSGPHDISGKFLPSGFPPQGLHLIEYTYKSLTTAFKLCNFRTVKSPLTSLGISRFEMLGCRKQMVGTSWKMALEMLLPKILFLRKGLSKMLGVNTVWIFAQK